MKIRNKNRIPVTQKHYDGTVFIIYIIVSKEKKTDHWVETAAGRY